MVPTLGSAETSSLVMGCGTHKIYGHQWPPVTKQISWCISFIIKPNMIFKQVCSSQQSKGLLSILLFYFFSNTPTTKQVG